MISFHCLIGNINVCTLISDSLLTSVGISQVNNIIVRKSSTSTELTTQDLLFVRNFLLNLYQIFKMNTRKCLIFYYYGKQLKSYTIDMTLVDFFSMESHLRQVYHSMPIAVQSKLNSSTKSLTYSC